MCYSPLTLCYCMHEGMHSFVVCCLIGCSVAVAHPSLVLLDAANHYLVCGVKSLKDETVCKFPANTKTLKWQIAVVEYKSNKSKRVKKIQKGKIETDTYKFSQRGLF